MRALRLVVLLVQRLEFKSNGPVEHVQQLAEGLVAVAALRHQVRSDAWLMVFDSDSPCLQKSPVSLVSTIQ